MLFLVKILPDNGLCFLLYEKCLLIVFFKSSGITCSFLRLVLFFKPFKREKGVKITIRKERRKVLPTNYAFVGRRFNWAFMVLSPGKSLSAIVAAIPLRNAGFSLTPS